MVTRRYGAAEDDSQSVERPLALQILHVMGPITLATEGAIEQLESVLGKGVLRWDEQRRGSVDGSDHSGSGSE
ncbi:hypothetical protein FRB94_002776 [Tulasnella sp. JGI-2019a]|nr:hypothetical protein FRB94_002776 [Tulasnella sp. JGI-2019a]KAG9012398.1 hypothetical protein FRB93_001821 [Tulasnella sp. JGI-2019a]KAG9031415.1 hypothetical protein FRB95_002779 [Tulasnella sp. JGI-2019a]